jgi:hypothetical protein
MSDPTTVNSGLALSDSMVTTVMDAAIAAVEAEIIAAVPELGLPVIKQVLELALHVVEGLTEEQLLRVATFLIVDAQTGLEQSNLVKAAGVLAAATATGNADAINQANQDFEKALAALIHFDGS